jgi:hypothetical protein
MAIRFRCENVRCGKLLQAPDSSVGQRVRCPDCRREQPVPFRAPEFPRGGDEALKVVLCSEETYTTRPAQPGGAASRGHRRKRTCPHCEEPIPSGAEECPACGESLEEEEGEPSPLRWENPELYGALRSANEKLEVAGGCFLLAVLSLLGLVTCVGLHMNWFDTLLGQDLTPLRSWWVYAVIFLTMGVLFWLIAVVRTRWTFQGIRPELFRLFERHGLSRYQVITQIEDDPKLEEIAKQLRQSS